MHPFVSYITFSGAVTDERVVRTEAIKLTKANLVQNDV